MKTCRIIPLFVALYLLLMNTSLHAQTSSQVNYSADGRSGSLTLKASDCTGGWWYDWEITVPANTPVKLTSQLFIEAYLDVYAYVSGGYQTIFYSDEPEVSITTVIASNGKIYVSSGDWLGLTPTSDVFTISFEVDSTVYSQTNNLHVPGKLSVASGLDVFGPSYINNRLGVGISPENSKINVYNSQDAHAIQLYSAKYSSSSLYGLYSTANNGMGNVYGIYSAVSGVSGKKWSGYFTGGDMAILNGNTGIGVSDPKGILQVRGTYENAWIYFSPNAGMASIKPTPKVNYGLAFTWNYSGGHGESIINYSRESGSFPRLDFTSFDGVKLTTEMTLKGGSLGIGIIEIPDSFKLAVAGKIIAEEVVVQLRSEWPDYVFTPDYHLLPLHKVEEFIKTNKRLPGLPSAVQVEEKGLSMGQMQSKLLQKIEELTLYIIEQDKKIKELEARLK